MIPSGKPFLPDLKIYEEYLSGIWARNHLTNHGPLVAELEQKLKAFFGVKHFFYVNNGTLALQIAIKALDLKGEIITTPFSYVATTSSIVWSDRTPVFVDIDPSDFTLDAGRIESAISRDTSAILATHIYGIPCATNRIQEIAFRHNLKVIYDAAHAFGVEIGGKGVLNFGDISTISFHATKLFHTVEGGGIATNNDELAHRINYMRNFGHQGYEDFYGLGINGKNSEFHAAMGLCLLPHIPALLNRRKTQSEHYDKQLIRASSHLKKPSLPSGIRYNYAYYPLIFETEETMLRVRDALETEAIYPRRYFYPVLTRLPYMKTQPMPVAESVSGKVLCLPLYHDLTLNQIGDICGIIASQLIR